jgi:hypothetical protein
VFSSNYEPNRVFCSPAGSTTAGWAFFPPPRAFFRHPLPVREVRRSGPWSEEQVREFLAESAIPMRLAANTGSGFPIVLSLWFLPEGDELLAAVHRSARIAKRLRADNRCAFEVAPNEPPYRGVRGQALATLEQDGARTLLERLLRRYLGSTNSNLGRFLLGRADEEFVVRLKPQWIASWDYSSRMKDV